MDKMVADFITNPPQGKKSLEFRDRIMGIPNAKNIAKLHSPSA